MSTNSEPSEFLKDLHSYQHVMDRFRFIEESKRQDRSSSQRTVGQVIHDLVAKEAAYHYRSPYPKGVKALTKLLLKKIVFRVMKPFLPDQEHLYGATTIVVGEVYLLLRRIDELEAKLESLQRLDQKPIRQTEGALLES